MTVQQIVPYAKYVTNGADSVYTVNFFIEDKENLFIKLNDVVVSMNDYNYLKDVNGIEFHTPLLANQKLEIFRKTKLERTTNFESFNNTFRPEVLNKDLDKIWLNLQEQSHKVDQYDLDYTYSVSTANQALKEVKDAQARADDAYELADLTNTETRPINRGGTGAASSEAARTNLNVHSKEEVVSLIQSGGAGTIVNVSGGGTGATTASQARTNLDVYSKTESNFLALPLGTPIWHNGTRLTIDDGYASYDGQLLNRADFPSLWAKVQSKFVVITDADWLADPKKRAAYSSGNGTTTFRMPDLNGFLSDSIKGLFLRGDGNGTIAGETVGKSTILTDAIRNITGSIQTGHSLSMFTEGQGVGAIQRDNVNVGATAAGTNGSTYSKGFTFDASRVVPTANENRPVSAVGIWVCRVSAGTAEQVSPNTAPSLTGGNTWGGSQSVQGNLTVSGKITGDIKPLLNATGDAPIYACRAWVNFNAVPLNGTYSQSGTTVTVTMIAHGMSVGQNVNLSVTSGTALSGSYPVATVIDANTFTYTAGTSLTTTGNITRNTFIRGSGNVLGITDNGVGDYTVNFITAMPDTNYVINGTGSVSNGNDFIVTGKQIGRAHV